MKFMGFLLMTPSNAKFYRAAVILYHLFTAPLPISAIAISRLGVLTLNISLTTVTSVTMPRWTGCWILA